MKCKIDITKYGVTVISIFACIFFMVSHDSYYFPVGDHHYVFINISKAIAETDKEFLSVALDTSFMKNSFYKLNSSEWELLAKLTQLLSPAYLRLGGTAADQVIFNFRETANKTKREYNFLKYENYIEEDTQSSTNYLNITGHDWVKFYNFVKKSGLRLILDLNVLLRNGSCWDQRNAEELLAFADLHNMSMDFQLGNEPNSFKHVFNISISGEQLGKDFNKLQDILSSWKRFKKSKLIGPDVTRVKFLGESSVNYLKEFLGSVNHLSAVSWHQYYLNGRTATLGDFLDPNVLDVFSKEIVAIKEIVRQFSPYVPIWLSETSSAYGGGAPGLSDTFAATYLWLDKLGVAANMGLKVVIRQTLFQGYYSLIDSDLKPLPDFWISLFYKQLIGRKVLRVRFDNNRKRRHLRFYASCLRRNEKIKGNIVLFGMNMGNGSEYIIPGGLRSRSSITSLIFTPEDGNLISKSILLNGRRLELNRLKAILDVSNITSQKVPLHMPPYSVAFWIFHGDKQDACQEE